VTFKEIPLTKIRIGRNIRTEADEELRALRPTGLFLAYDKPEDREPVAEAAKMLWAAGFTKTAHSCRCYVLVGYPGDSTAEAEHRLRETLAMGLFPMAMLYRDGAEVPSAEWRRFIRHWARAYLVACKAMGAS